MAARKRKAASAEPESAAVAQDKYNPTPEEEKLITDEYVDFQYMREARDRVYPEFGDITLQQFVDANDKQLNARVIKREEYEQPKEAWQSNVPLPIIREKQEQVLGGYSLVVPDMECKAYGTDNALDLTDRAYVAKWLVTGSYTQEENSVLENFWESWEAAGRGTIIKYEGYLKTKATQRVLTKYDLETGIAEYVEKEVTVDDKCVSWIVPILELYIKDFSIQDIQQQPKLVWARKMSKDAFEYEFGKYANAKFVKTKGELTHDDHEGFYGRHKDWFDHVDDDQYEVLRIYCKTTQIRPGVFVDTYRIIANGVLLMDAPLLWKSNGVKIYPFAKTIFKPFVNEAFFYGNCFPNLMGAMVDSMNSTFNTMSDKQWRSMNPGTLVGRVNQDSLDFEEQIITGTTPIHVEDVNQVKPMPVEGINSADVLFLNIVKGFIEDAAPSLPGLMKDKEATAREIVLAEEKLREMKNVYAEFMTDLWRQKYKIRLANIQLNYPQPRTIVVDGQPKKITKTYIITDAELDTITGERGILAIKFQAVTAENRAKLQEEIDVEEEAFAQKGIKYRKLICNTDYLDNARYQIEIISGAVYRENIGRKQAEIAEKLETLAKFFPDILIINKNEYFEQWSSAYEDSPGKYLAKVQEFEKAKQEAMAAQANPTAPGGGEAQPSGEVPAGSPTGAPAEAQLAPVTA